MPELYLLIIFSAIFAPSVALLLILLSLFGWMGLSHYVRAEFLRNRQMDYVRAARALGVGNGRIMWRHILPNSMTPVVTFLPFRMSAAILALTSLDFLGLGVPPGTPSLGELLSRARTTSMPGGSRCHLRRAGADAAAADLHGRRLARCAGSAKGRHYERIRNCWT
jgi:microcin C transport system permease protein